MHVFFCVIFGWQCVKNYDGLLKEHGFGCIGGGNVPFHVVAKRWARRCTKRHIAQPWQRHALLLLCCFWFVLHGKTRWIH